MYVRRWGMKTWVRWAAWSGAAAALFSVFVLSLNGEEHDHATDKGTKKEQATDKAIPEITGMEHIEKVLESSKDRLLVFDLYADWCMPCRILSPMLTKIANEHGDKADFYKINVDKHPQIAGAFGASGIPFVVFVRDKTGLEALTGVQPAETYVRTINRLVADKMDVNVDAPNGDLVEGIRVINLSPEMAPGKLYVYRGETVKLVYGKVKGPYSIHIPEYGVSTESNTNGHLEVTFKADKVGVFPVFCNGDCPTGDGSSFGQIIVMQYEAQGDARFDELDAEKAKALIEKNQPLILDVRTPKEYYAGHIPGSKLIPLAQLDRRVGEIRDYRDKGVLLYCRSGNRSTVAAEILVRHGFKKPYHLRSGLKGWRKTGYKVASKT